MLEGTIGLEVWLADGSGRAGGDPRSPGLALTYLLSADILKVRVFRRYGLQ